MIKVVIIKSGFLLTPNQFQPTKDLFFVEISLSTKRSYFLQNQVLQSLIKVLFSFLKKRGHPVL